MLSMAIYSIARERSLSCVGVKVQFILPISVGAAVGGVLGKMVFQQIVSGHSISIIGIAQSVCLIVAISGTIFYTLAEEKVRTLKIENYMVRFMIGLLLGALSAFLGIGGGPFNLVVLSFYFSLRGRGAVISSLLIILVAQLTSLLFQAITQNVPLFSLPALLVMVVGGISGGIIGRALVQFFSAGMVNNLFLGANGLILWICVWNIIGYLR